MIELNTILQFTYLRCASKLLLGIPFGCWRKSRRNFFGPQRERLYLKKKDIYGSLHASTSSSSNHGVKEVNELSENKGEAELLTFWLVSRDHGFQKTFETMIGDVTDIFRNTTSAANQKFAGKSQIETSICQGVSY